MIVRISGEDQYELADDQAGALHELEHKLSTIVETGREEDFHAAFEELLDFVRTHGTAIPDEQIESSDLILPPADISFAEAAQEFTGEGLIPD